MAFTSPPPNGQTLRTGTSILPSDRVRGSCGLPTVPSAMAQFEITFKKQEKSQNQEVRDTTRIQDNSNIGILINVQFFDLSQAVLCI